MSAWVADVLRAGSMILAQGVTVPPAVAVAGAFLALTATVAAAVAVARSAAIKASAQTLTEINEELRRGISDIRAELDREKERRAQLEGRLDVLTSGLAERIIAAVADTWHRAHESTGGTTP